MCEQQTALLIQQINAHQLHIHQLELRLAESQRQLQTKCQQIAALEQKPIASSRFKLHIQGLLKDELEKRMKLIGTRFEQLEELFVQNVYARNKSQRSIYVRSPSRPVSPIRPAQIQDLQRDTDAKLQSVVEQNRRFQQQLRNACSNLQDEILQLEQAMQKIYTALKVTHSKAQRCRYEIRLADDKMSELKKNLTSATSIHHQYERQQPDEFQSFSEDLPGVVESQIPRLRGKPTKELVSPFETELGGQSPDPSGQTTIVYPRSIPPTGTWQLEDRLRRAVAGKKLPTPIPVFLDDQCFIRKADGAYLFDMDGDIFKTSLAEFRRLCQLRLLVSLEE